MGRTGGFGRNALSHLWVAEFADVGQWGLKPGSPSPCFYRGNEALRHPKSTFRGPFGFAQATEAPFFHGAARLRLCFRFFRAVENVVNRQKLHDWGYVVAGKGKIVRALVALLPFAA